MGEILAGAAQPKKLLTAVLKQTLLVVYAERGLLFDRAGMIMSVGYKAEDSEAVRQRLAPLLIEGGRRFYELPLFQTAPPPPDAEIMPDSSGQPPAGALAGDGLGRRKALGMAGVVALASGPLAVLAVERNHDFRKPERRWFDGWLELVSIPAGAAAESARAQRLRESGKLKLQDLPLDRLEELPALQEVERMIIAEAMRRSQNNKTLAAAALGITREGLRKKILRLAT